MQMQKKFNFGGPYLKIDITDFVEKFNLICERINKFNAGSETRFLSIGTELQKYLNNSRQLTNLASTAASSISDEILNKGINQLTVLLEEFRYYITITTEVIKNDRHELSDILPDVFAITDHLQGFDKIIKQLRMLGISTKIESARLGAEDQGFFALAETVDKLSGLINEKAKTILEKSNYLIDELNRTTANLAKLEKDQSEQSNIIINKITHSLSAFKSKYDKSAQKAEKISFCSEGVSSNISEIVTSIQFHDITRQRLEHTKTAFDGLIFKIESGEDEIMYEDMLGEIYDITVLESSQLKNAVDEFKNAVNKITNSLMGVEKNVAGMLSETVELIYENDNDGKNSLKSVSEELKIISNGLKKNVGIGNELSLSINSVISIVDNLSKYVMEIEDIGTEIELIALNARVKAARTGKNGSALGVLSETIQRLSVDAKYQTGSTSHVLNDISAKSKSLRVNLEKGTYKLDGQKLILSTDKISELIFTLTDLEKKAEKDIKKLSEDVSKLKEEINSTAKELTVNEEASRLYNDIKMELDIISEEILADGNFNSDLETNTKNMMNRYTMDNERAIHKNVTNQRQSGLTEDNLINNYSQDNLLGDNVELF